MTETGVRQTIGVSLVLAHLIVMGLLFVLFVLNGFTFDELTTAIAIISPMFAVYTTGIVRYIIDSRSLPKMEEGPVRGSFVFLSFLMAFLFTAALVSMVLLKAFNMAFSNFEQFKHSLTIIEIIFAVYVGQIVGSLFKEAYSGGGAH